MQWSVVSPFREATMSADIFQSTKRLARERRSTVTGVVASMVMLPLWGRRAFAQELLGVQAGPLATLTDWAPFILSGFLLNLAISFLAMLLATVLGVGLGLLRISRIRVASSLAWMITQIFRNSPWLVILFVVMLMLPFRITLPYWGSVSIPDWAKATIAFALPVMANISEIVRGAVASIPLGQWESAESLAFTRGQTLRHVILPQCIKRSIPPWMNWYAIMTLATPMASILGVEEALSNTQAAMNSAGSRPEFLVPFYFFLMGLFFIYIYPIAKWTQRLEKKYAVRL